MTDYSDRYRRPSPRTAEEPMAFTVGEFVRGAAVAWVAFIVLAPVTVMLWTLLGTVLRGQSMEGQWEYLLVIPLYAPMYTIPWSAGALILIGAPWAFMLGTALRRIPVFGPHHSSFALLGATVGAITIVALQLWNTLPAPGVTFEHMLVKSPWESVDWLIVALMAITTAVVVVFGWRWTAKRALRADQEQAHPAADT